MSTVHDEGKDIFVPITFFDEHRAPVTPLSADYRVTKGDGTQLMNWTAIGSLGPNVEVVVPAQYNIVTGDGIETRNVAVRFIYGTPTRTGTAGLEYRLQNLKAFEP